MLEVVEQAAAGDARYRDALAGVRRDYVARATPRHRPAARPSGIAASDVDAAVAAGRRCARMVEGFAPTLVRARRAGRVDARPRDGRRRPSPGCGPGAVGSRPRATARDQQRPMSITPEHEQFRKVVRDFVENEINPHVEAWEAAGTFPAHELFPKLAALALFGLEYYPEFGGRGADHSFTVVLAEDSAGRTAPACRWPSPSRRRWPRRRSPRFGSAELKRATSSRRSAARWSARSPCPSRTPARRRRPSARGPCATATTGSSTAARCGSPTAPRPTGCACSPAPATRAATPGCRSSSCRRPRRASASGGGSTRWATAPATPPSSCSTTCACRSRTRSARSAAGFQQQMQQFQDERIIGSYMAVAGARRALDRTIDYLREREAFGKPLLANQHLQYRLARAARRHRRARGVLPRRGRRGSSRART